MATAPTAGDKQILAAVAGVSSQVKAIVPPNPATDLTNVVAGLTTLGGKLDKILAALKAAPAGPVVVDPPTPPPPVATDWPLGAQPAAGSSVSISAGAKTGSYHFDFPDVTLIGAGSKLTVIDGQGGKDGGHRLAWGKGQLHWDKNGSVRDVGFVGNADAGGGSDGEAAVYCEGGVVNVLRCRFDRCENGAYMQPREFMPAGTKAYMYIDKCVFGQNGANGLNDGRSHDVYLGGDGATITRSVFQGTSRGNTVKLRGNTLVLEDNYIARSNGRWVDLPGGTQCTSTRNTYVTNLGAGSNNALGFMDENDTKNTDYPGFFRSVDDTFYFSRQREVIWVNSPSFVVSFVGAKVFWIGAAGSPPPVVEVLGKDMTAAVRLQGDNPFVFTEANRVDAPPPVPAV